MNTRENRHFNIILCVFRVLALCETCFLCVYASVSALRKPDRIEFSLASSNLSICLLFSYSQILTFLNALCTVQQVHFSLCPTGSYVRICSWFVLNESLPKSSLPNIFVSFLFIDKNVNRFMSLFLSFKKSFRSQRVFVVVSQKNVVDKLWWKLFINEIKTAARALNLGPSQALAQNAHALARPVSDSLSELPARVRPEQSFFTLVPKRLIILFWLLK